MSITDELRKWMRSHTVNCSDNRIALVAIADSIDREHRMALEKVAAEADALPMTDESMAEHGWVRLPLDADGVPIRVGDVMDFLGGMTVSAIGKDDVYFFADNYSDGVYTEAGFHLRHHHAPTVEDVLREFAYGLGVSVADSYIAASAAKLRLAGDDE